MLSLGKDLIEGLLKRITAEASCLGSHASEHRDRCEEHLAEIGSNIRSGHCDDLDVCPLRSHIDERGIEDHQSAGLELLLELLHGRLVKADNNICVIYNG